MTVVLTVNEAMAVELGFLAPRFHDAAGHDGDWAECKWPLCEWRRWLIALNRDGRGNELLPSNGL